MIKRAIIFVGVLLPSAVVAAETAEDCRAIEDPQERLGCYDRQFSRSPPADKDAATGPLTEAVTEAADATTEAATESSTDAATEPGAETASRPRTTSEDAGKAGLFDLDERVDLTSTITHVHSKPQQKMVFQLENDQVWMQSVPRMLQIREGDRVRIENASIGGFMMRTERGVTTRVERIR